MSTAGRFGSASALSMIFSPDFPGMRRSVRITSNGCVSIRLNAFVGIRGDRDVVVFREGLLQPLRVCVLVVDDEHARHLRL